MLFKYMQAEDALFHYKTFKKEENSVFIITSIICRAGVFKGVEVLWAMNDLETDYFKWTYFTNAKVHNVTR